MLTEFKNIQYGYKLFYLFHQSLKNIVSLKPFLPFLDTKPFFAIKMTNHHDKQLTPPESWDQYGFFEPGFGYHQRQIIGLEFLQRCGHKNRVSTWTGSYAKNAKNKNKITPFGCPSKLYHLFKSYSKFC